MFVDIYVSLLVLTNWRPPLVNNRAHTKDNTRKLFPIASQALFSRMLSWDFPFGLALLWMIRALPILQPPLRTGCVFTKLESLKLWPEKRDWYFSPVLRLRGKKKVGNGRKNL